MKYRKYSQDINEEIYDTCLLFSGCEDGCPFKGVGDPKKNHFEEIKNSGLVFEFDSNLLPEKENKECPECGGKIEGSVCQGACKGRLL